MGGCAGTMAGRAGTDGWLRRDRWVASPGSRLLRFGF
jgi:hypothetical protein